MRDALIAKGYAVHYQVRSCVRRQNSRDGPSNYEIDCRSDCTNSDVRLYDFSKRQRVAVFVKVFSI